MLGRDPVNFLLQKAGHFTEYLILALLLYRAVRGTLNYLGRRQAGAPPAPDGSRQAYLWTLALAALFAVSDEWHQSFVPRREPTLRDVLIDTAGVLAALALTRWWEGRRRPAPEPKVAP